MPWDLLVIANPAWETTRLVNHIPEELNPRTSTGTIAGGDTDGSVITDGGGSALNTACALATAGRRVLAVGRVGDDAPGRACLEALRRRGVETACEVLPGRTTKRNVCFVERETRATAFAVELLERAVPPWEEFPDTLLEARVLLLDRLAAAAPSWLKARTGARHNAFVRNSAILSPAGHERFAAALAHFWYLQIPEDPDTNSAPTGVAQTPSGTAERNRIHRPRSLPPPSAEAITAMLAAGVRLLVRTRGMHGVVVHSADGLVMELPAAPTEVIDPTGAGDAFAAGFLHASLDGLDAVDSARQGLDWAARACRHLGARAWLDSEPPG
jgi:ribokinase